MKLLQRIRRLLSGSAPERISRHTLRDIGQDPLAMHYSPQTKSTPKDPWCQAC